MYDDLVKKVDPNTFSRFMGEMAKEGLNLDRNLSIIQAYFEHVKDENTRLNVENNLHLSFLKKYETEESYNKFYLLMAEFHNKNLRNKKQ